MIDSNVSMAASIFGAFRAPSILVEPGGVVTLNERAMEVFGAVDARMSRDVFSELVTSSGAHEGEVRRCFFDIERATADSSERICRVVGRGGTRRFLSVMAPTVFDDGGFIVSFADATLRQELARDAVDASNQLQTLLASARGFAIYRARRDDNALGATIELVSPSLRDILGVPLDAPFEHWFRTIHPDDAERVGAAHVASVTQGVVFDVRMRFWHEGASEWRWVHAISHPQRDGLGVVTHFNGLLIDISAEVEAESERARLAARLAEGERLEAVGRLASGVAHDFNNLLAVMSACVDLLVEQPPDFAELLEELASVIKRASGLTRQMLDYARAGAHRRDRLDVEALVDRAIASLRRVRPEVPLLRGACSDAMAVIGDASQLDRVILNLLLNASDALGDVGGVRVSWSVDASLDVPEVAIVVEDDGHGIEPDVMRRVFEPFFTTKPIGGGTGMGLAAAQGIVSAHGGRLELSSEPGVGTVATVRLPLATTARPEDSSEAVDEVRRVLVIDGEGTLRRAVCEGLGARGVDVLDFVNAEGAIAWARLHQHELARSCAAIVDVHLPGMDGVECSRALRAISPELDVLFCSGFIPPGLACQLGRDPRSRVIQKPFSIDEVHEALESLCQKTH